jgi:16S rRNA processing protein RimM
VKSYTADPKAIASYGPVTLEDGRRLILTHARPAPGSAPDLLIVRAEGVETREAAEALNRTRILVERERLASPEDEDEFLLADLVGLPAYSPSGDLLGTVIAVPNYGGGDLLELRPPKGPSALLPFTRVFVPEVDVPGRRIVVDPPTDLFERGRPEPGEDGA